MITDYINVRLSGVQSAGMICMALFLESYVQFKKFHMTGRLYVSNVLISTVYC